MLSLEKLKNSTVHVIGVSGAEGSSLALFLSGLGVKNLIGHDFKQPADFKKSFFAYHDNLSAAEKKRLYRLLLRSLTSVRFKNNYLRGINRQALIFAPSSCFRYLENKKLRRFKTLGWYNLLLELFSGTIIGVSGTAGKGTVTNLIYQILKSQKRKVFLVGESWHYSDFAKIIQAGQSAIVVAEVNNRVLTFAKNTRRSPAVCLLTNILRHHLDDHHNSFSQYKKIKLALCKYQKPGEVLLINAEDPVLNKMSWPKQTRFYSLKSRIGFTITNPYFKNEHLLSDAIAAVLVARMFKATTAAISKTVNSFKPRTARFEPIRTWRGVTFINDAAATRPGATIFAIKSLPVGKTLLILEGSRSNPQLVKSEYLELIKIIRQRKVRAVFLSGQIDGYLYPLFKVKFDEVMLTDNLAASVRLAWLKAKAGDTILLSPAHESFGEFSDYRARSRRFVKLVKQLK